MFNSRLRAENKWCMHLSFSFSLCVCFHSSEIGWGETMLSINKKIKFSNAFHVTHRSIANDLMHKFAHTRTRNRRKLCYVHARLFRLFHLHSFLSSLCNSIWSLFASFSDTFVPLFLKLNTVNHRTAKRQRHQTQKHKVIRLTNWKCVSFWVLEIECVPVHVCERLMRLTK